MLPKPIKQTLKYNELLMPKDHRRIKDTSNFELWNEISAINSSHPSVQINIEYVVRDFGHYYGIDMQLSCNNPVVQQQLDAAYQRSMQIPRFRKHEEFLDMNMMG